MTASAAGILDLGCSRGEVLLLAAQHWTTGRAVAGTSDFRRPRCLVPAGLNTGSAGIVFRAWDHTDRNPDGATGIDVSTNGDATAYTAPPLPPGSASWR